MHNSIEPTDYVYSGNPLLFETEFDYTIQQTSYSKASSMIKTWLNTKRMINDSVDILDAKVVNLGVKFSAITNEALRKGWHIENLDYYKALSFKNVNKDQNH